MTLTAIQIVMTQIVSMIISVLDDVKAMQIVEQMKYVLQVLVLVLVPLIVSITGRCVVMTAVVAHVVSVIQGKYVISLDNVSLLDAKQMVIATTDKYV